MKKWWHWLETHAAVPEFSGGLLLFLAIFLFAAATNTLAGWLYVISGVSIALLLIGAFFPSRFLAELQVQRAPTAPVGVGNELYLSLQIANRGQTSKHLLEVRDVFPAGLSPITEQTVVIPTIPPRTVHQWHYNIPVHRRGIYYLQPVQIATASPFGLFRSRRQFATGHTKLVVYPLILPLAQCPILEALGQEQQTRQYSPQPHRQQTTEGLTRTLRPYRWGDPMRLIHWRSSARYGDLRVRELETTSSGQEVVIALDLDPHWSGDHFEQAVMVAGTLYFYARRQQLQVQFYSSTTGLIAEDRPLLETLASIQPNSPTFQPPPLPLLVITHRPELVLQLSAGDRFILWRGLAQPTRQGIAVDPPVGEPYNKTVQQFWQAQLQSLAFESNQPP
ncbi:MAG: DUF58 domain-containing protein [Pseudanabaenaceae cyanobacterium]